MTEQPDEPTLDEVLEAELPRYAEALERLGGATDDEAPFMGRSDGYGKDRRPGERDPDPPHT